MTTALSLKVHSQLPQALSHVLATPSCTELEQLWWRFQADEKQLRETFSILCNGSHGTALSYLMRSGNSDYAHAINAGLSNSSLDVAHKLLSADYWNSAICKTDINDHMPAGRKAEWSEQIKNLEFPAFTLEAIYATLSTLLNERDRFFAERVDGFYRVLSGDHLTNSINSFGFYKRMIIADVHENGSASTSKCEYISDLRYVLGRFLKREGTVSSMATTRLIERLLKKSGEWHEVDGGTLRMKVFQKGTLHIEIAPSLALDLNEILAILYPKAIAAEYRTKQRKEVKEFNLTKRLVSFDVIDKLTDMRPVYDERKRTRIPNTFSLSSCSDKHLYAQCKEVLVLIGGVEQNWREFKFDYDPSEILNEIYITGAIPDKASHQFYPTPEPLAEKMANLLGALPGDSLLEPSAGRGMLAKFLKGKVTCIEVSALFCKILQETTTANVEQADFLQWQVEAKASGNLFAGVLMNPPFSMGRAYEHIMAASELLVKNGVLVALVPSATAAKFKAQMKQNVEVLPVNAEEFSGVSIDLAIVRYKA